MTLLAAFASGCAVSHKTVIKPSERPAALQTATREELIARYNSEADAITSLNAAVTIRLTAGSAYTGVIEQYHEVNGFILAQKPSSIRVIGQAPVVSKDIFDMESDGTTFHIFIPSKNKFITGPAVLERPSAKPIENLRPQHLIDAIFWQAIPEGAPVLLEETNEAASHDYALTVIRPAVQAAGTNANGPAGWEIARKIWFDRSDLNVARMATYDSGGKISSNVRYTGWSAFGAVKYAREISLDRPGNDYDLQIGIKKLTVNEPIAAGRFVLEQPPGTELVRVGEDSTESQP